MQMAGVKKKIGSGAGASSLAPAPVNYCFFMFCLSVYFSWRQEKYQKKRAPQLGLRLPSRKRIFRCGQELASLRQPARFFRKIRPRSAALQWAGADIVETGRATTSRFVVCT